jgi:hypothetical protein
MLDLPLHSKCRLVCSFLKIASRLQEQTGNAVACDKLSWFCTGFSCEMTAIFASAGRQGRHFN